jgi:hypothetical protein
MSRVAFARAMRSMPSFRSLMDAYVRAFLEQVMVSVACNGAHSLKQRLARWVSCECYQLVRARLAFHLPKTYE